MPYRSMVFFETEKISESVAEEYITESTSLLRAVESKLDTVGTVLSCPLSDALNKKNTGIHPIRKARYLLNLTNRDRFNTCNKPEKKLPIFRLRFLIWPEPLLPFRAKI